jgi:6-phosphogluconolactonase
MPEIRVLDDAEAVAHAAAEEFVAQAGAAAAAQGRFSVALSGGSTPRALYGLLASEPYRQRVDWSKVHVFFGDERCVPPDDSQSNYRMAREALLDRVLLPAENVHRPRGEIDPAQAADDYERLLREWFQPRHAAAVAHTFDLVLLGMGDDGHTASLFPGTAAVRQCDRWVVAHFVEQVDMWRITLTPPVINAAAEVAFLVEGAHKASRLREVLQGPMEPGRLPAQIIRPQGRLLWLVDRAAAARLDPRSPA